MVIQRYLIQIRREDVGIGLEKEEKGKKLVIIVGRDSRFKGQLEIRVIRQQIKKDCFL